MITKVLSLSLSELMEKILAGDLTVRFINHNTNDGNPTFVLRANLYDREDNLIYTTTDSEALMQLTSALMFSIDRRWGHNQGLH